MAAHNWASSSFPFQMMPAAAAAPAPPPSSWMDDFLDFSTTRRNAHRRTVSDPIAFVEDSNAAGMGFDRLDDEQLRNMFSDDFVGAVGSSSNPSSANPSTPSDQNTDEDDKKAAAELRRFQPKPERKPSPMATSSSPRAEPPPACTASEFADPTSSCSSSTTRRSRRVPRRLHRRRGRHHREDEIWREKLQSICPAEGMIVKHIKTGEDLRISRRLVATFLLMTVADFSDQLFSFQDSLFDNRDGRLDFAGNNTVASLWPGDGKPGLWMNSASRMAAIYTLLAREEEIYLKTAENRGEDRDGDLELVIPPVFDQCTRILDREEQIAARDLYWEAVCGAAEMGVEKAEGMLVESVARNPFVGESYVVLAQIYLGKGEFAAAEAAAARGLRLLVEWGSPWDKRMTWQGWVAWCRVLLTKARDKSWPQTSWGILNLGLVK